MLVHLDLLVQEHPPGALQVRLVRLEPLVQEHLFALLVQLVFVVQLVLLVLLVIQSEQFLV